MRLGNLFSLDEYHISPRGHDPTHYHRCLEIVYVRKGESQSHHQGKLYLYKSGQVHEVINNSPNDLVVTCLTIPPEDVVETVYVAD